MNERYVETVKDIGKYEAYWRPIHRAVEEKVAFLFDGQHYDDNGTDELEKDRRLARWVGQETTNVHRHELGTVTQHGTSVQARAVDEYGDDDLGEQAVSMVEAEVENPQKCFEEAIEDAVSCASAAGYGVAAVEFMPHEGPWGELNYFAEDIRDFMWDPRAKSIHEHRCSRVIVRRRPRLSEVKRMRGLKRGVVGKLRPDGGYRADFFRTLETSLQARVGAAGVSEDWTDDDAVTLYFVWTRGSGKAKRPIPGSVRPLPEGGRFLLCGTCGWQSDPEAASGVAYEEAEACPHCGAIAERQDAVEDETAIWGYPDIRLQIVAPYAGVEEFLYDSHAPIPARSFPFFFVTRTRHPFKPFGPGIVDWNWWNQVCADLVMTLAIERLMASAPVWSVPVDGVFDAMGERWEFSDEQGPVMFRDSNTPAGAVQLLEGSGIPASWSPVYRATREALLSHQGIADFGLGPEQSRDIAASSVSQQIQQQEIPQAHYQRRIAREKARFFGIVYDYIRATYPPERVMRLRGPDGADAVRALDASAMPNFDFVLMDAPDFTALDEAKAKGLQQLMSAAQEGPEMLELVASVYHIPPSLVRRFQRAAEARQARAEQAAASAANGAMVPGAGTSEASPAPPPAASDSEQDGYDVNSLVAEILGPQAVPQ